MEEERASKRARIGVEQPDEGGENRSSAIQPSAKEKKRRLQLPPELWALILEFSPYSVVMQCTAVSSFFLKQVLPMIQILCIQDFGELDVRQADRFSNGCVKVIMIATYLQEVPHLMPSHHTALRIVPFLSKFTATLKSFAIGDRLLRYKHSSRDVIEGRFNTFAIDSGFAHAEWREIHRSLLRAFCGAFLFRQIPQTVKAVGLLDYGPTCEVYPLDSPDSSFGRGPCRVCETIVNTFPLKRVVPYLTSTNSLCIPTGICILIAADRPGGKELLQDPKTLCETLRNFPDAFYEGLPNASPAFLIRTLPAKLIELLTDYVNYTEADPSKIDRKTLVDILREGQELQRFPIFESSFQKLVELKFNITEEDVILVKEEPDGLKEWVDRKKYWPSGGEAYIVRKKDEAEEGEDQYEQVVEEDEEEED